VGGADDAEQGSKRKEQKGSGVMTGGRGLKMSEAIEQTEKVLGSL